LRKAGVFNNTISMQPSVEAITRDMLAKIEHTRGRRVADWLGERVFGSKAYLNPMNALRDLRRLNDLTTWNIDEVLRISTFLSLKEGYREALPGRLAKKGLSDLEMAELANDFLANYGKVPRQTRRWLNRFIFTPTYRISMARMLAKMWASPKKFWPQLMRHYAWKLFVTFVLPGLTAVWLYGRKWDEGKGEKGYRVVITTGKGKQTAISLSDPLLEGAKISQRPFFQTLEYNLAAVPNMMLNVFRGPKFKNERDKFGHIFKLGTPFWRDVVQMTDEDKGTAEKILTTLGVAYVYKRRAQKGDDDKAVESLAKALSIWTDWKMQKEGILRAVGIEPDKPGRKKPKAKKRVRRTR